MYPSIEDDIENIWIVSQFVFNLLFMSGFIRKSSILKRYNLAQNVSIDTIYAVIAHMYLHSVETLWISLVIEKTEYH